MKGGTSVNTIAQDAMLELDLRGETKTRLQVWSPKWKSSAAIKAEVAEAWCDGRCRGDRRPARR